MTPNDPKLSDGGGQARRLPVVARWWRSLAAAVTGRSRSLQRMVRRLRSITRRRRRMFIVRLGRELAVSDPTGLYGAMLTDETKQARQLELMLRTQERGWPKRDKA